MGTSNTRVPAGPDSRRGVLRRVSEPVAAYCSAAILATAALVVALGGHVGRLALPLGGEDVLQAYNVARLWGSASWFGDTGLGFPFGMDLRYYPTADVVQNGLGGLVAAVTGNPFLGMNLVYAASFPAVAVAALWVVRLTGLRGPVTVLASLAFVTIPFHWLRVEHIYLATLYSAVLGVGLAILVGTGEAERRVRSWRRPRQVLPLVAVVVLIALSGIYYVCFTVLLSLTALAYRWARGASAGGVLRDGAVVVALVAVLACALAPAALFERSHPALQAVAHRAPEESVSYSGALALALVPSSASWVPGVAEVTEPFESVAQAPGLSGVTWASNSGALLTTLAAVFAACGLVVIARRSAMGHTLPSRGAAGQGGEPGPGLVAALLAATALFFVPWGLNVVFASVVTPQLRGWDRLLPILLLLLLVLAAVTWRRLGLAERGRRAWVVTAVGMLVVLLDGVLPYRATFTQAAGLGGQWHTAGVDYAARLNAAIPGDCGVLQLPYMGYPEVPATEGLATYGHYWPALTNPEKRWSYGAMKGTVSSAWLEELGADLDARAVGMLAEAGFCAVHVDLTGFSQESGADLVDGLEALLGDPVAEGSGGTWLAFAIPGSAAAGSISVDGLVDASDEVQTFFLPPSIEAVDDAAVRPDPQADQWSLEETAELAVRAICPEADFRTVSGVLRAPSCGDRSVEVTLRSGSAVDSAVVDVPADGSAEFALTLGDAVADATLQVRSLGSTCTAAEGEGHVILDDPVARY